MPKISREKAASLAVTALMNGATLHVGSDGRVGKRHVEWDVSGNCERPVMVELTSERPRKRDGKFVCVPVDGTMTFIDMEVRCRKCKNCLRKRAAQWRHRALHEYQRSGRTWFATLTIAPENRALANSAAVVRAEQQGKQWSDLLDDERYAHKVVTSYDMVTLFWKRLRKRGAQFTYLVVAEPHKSGEPHFHALIHEYPDNAITWRTLADEWWYGVTEFTLVHDTIRVAYVCKYLHKSIGARVRASVDYGKDRPKPKPVSEKRGNPDTSEKH